MPLITIQGVPIDFPDSSQEPNWAPAVIQFAQAVSAALSVAVGTFDVPQQTLDIAAQNPGTNINIPALSFSTSTVRSVLVYYSVFRHTSTTTAYESGSLNFVYSPDNSIGNKWEPGKDRIGDASISFYMTDTGQIQFSTQALGGINHTGKISFSAKALLQT